MFNLLDQAKATATLAHAGQTRRDGQTPYITHPARVVELLHDFPEGHRAVAWLHDVIEDTHLTSQDLRARGFPSDIVDDVLLLTRMAGDDYALYLARLSPRTRAVKIADMLANLTDNPTPRQKERYVAGILKLAAWGL